MSGAKNRPWYVMTTPANLSPIGLTGLHERGPRSGMVGDPLFAAEAASPQPSQIPIVGVTTISRLISPDASSR